MILECRGLLILQMMQAFELMNAEGIYPTNDIIFQRSQKTHPEQQSQTLRRAFP